MSPDLDNPAARLGHVLVKAKQLGDGTPAIQRWAEVFEVEVEVGPVLQGGTQTIALARQVKNLITKLPADETPELLLEHWGEVDSTLGNFANLGQFNMQTFTQSLSQMAINNVRYAAGALRRSGYREPAIADDERKRLIAEVRELIDEVMESDLDPISRRDIVAALRDVEDTLRNAILSGGDDLSRSAAGLVGTMLGTTPQDPTRFWSKPVVQRVGKFAAGFVAAVAVQVSVDAAEQAIMPTPAPSVTVLNYLLEQHSLPALPAPGAPPAQLPGKVLPAEDGPH